MLTILGGLAEFERTVIRERVKAGLERARAQGKTLGSPHYRRGDRCRYLGGDHDAAGRLMLTIPGGLAEFERAMRFSILAPQRRDMVVKVGHLLDQRIKTRHHRL
jgi:DNA invertase Pin-like site-specific DNA recombinase